MGVGNLGSALLDYHGFNREGYAIQAAFDVRAAELNAERKASAVPIHHAEKMPTFIRENDVKMAILCVPATVAQSVANELVACGVQGILNFAPTMLVVPEGVRVNHVDLAMELENLSYFIPKRAMAGV